MLFFFALTNINLNHEFSPTFLFTLSKSQINLQPIYFLLCDMIVRKWESLNIYTWNMKSHKALTGIDLCKNLFIRLSDIAMYPGTLRSDREPNKCKGKMRWRIEGLFCNFLLTKRSSIIPTWSRLMVIFMVEKLKLWPIRIWKLLQKYYIQRDLPIYPPLWLSVGTPGPHNDD